MRLYDFDDPQYHRHTGHRGADPALLFGCRTRQMGCDGNEETGRYRDLCNIEHRTGGYPPIVRPLPVGKGYRV